MSRLLSPIKIREVSFRNRIFLSPMCQYSAVEGMPNDWHLVHLGSRAVGGNALVMTEATAVSPEGRISPADLGIWSDEQAEAFARIAGFVKQQGAVPGIQLAHAGRKASAKMPWEGEGAAANGGWEPIGPSPVGFADNYTRPRAVSDADITHVIDRFVAAAKRALAAGFQVAELHMAHGYLLHEFLSPLSNRRTDQFGGSLMNRARLPLEIAKRVRAVWPDEFPLFVRISATDWTDGGWEIEQSIQFAKWLKEVGVDLIDTSSGGNVAQAHIPVAPGYQAVFAERIRREAGIMTGAVGLITDPHQAEHILVTGQADAIFMGRELLRNPYFPLHAAHHLGDDPRYPLQYLRAKPK